jgi:hypothetical protein
MNRSYAKESWYPDTITSELGRRAEGWEKAILSRKPFFGRIACGVFHLVAYILDMPGPMEQSGQVLTGACRSGGLMKAPKQAVPASQLQVFVSAL